MAFLKCQVTQENGVSTVREIYRVVVHRFRISDSDDPEIYAAEPIMEWQRSEAGQFVMKHAVDIPEFHKHIDHERYGYEFAITAELEKKTYTEFLLRFGKHGSNQS